MNRLSLPTLLSAMVLLLLLAVCGCSTDNGNDHKRVFLDLGIELDTKIDKEKLISELKNQGVNFKVSKDNVVKYSKEDKAKVEKILANLFSKPSLIVEGERNLEIYKELFGKHNINFSFSPISTSNNFIIYYDIHDHDKVTKTIHPESRKKIIENM